MAAVNAIAEAPRPRRILFCLQSLWYLRNVVTVLESLAAAGHEVVLITLQDGSEDAPAALQLRRMLAAHPQLHHMRGPVRRGLWAPFASYLRRAIDLLYFRGPAFATKPGLLGRAERRAPAIFNALCRRGLWRTPAANARMLQRLCTAERALPVDRAIRRHLQALNGDALVVCPLIDLGVGQGDHVRAADAIGLRSLLLVHSWDNLSSKTLIRTVPDRVAVWNPAQVEEAAQFHGLPPDRIVVTGAPPYDAWFTRRPEMSRADFAGALGFDPTRPIILYVCSATFGHKHVPEHRFIKRWLKALRHAEAEVVRHANVLIRPHPKRAGVVTRDRLDLADGHGQRVAIWPDDAQNPVSIEARSTYFHSLWHADAVVGINTSAMIEAAILRKPMLTVLDPEFSASQDGTFHFAYLLDGPLRAAATLEDHVAQLARALDGAEPAGAREQRFVAEFVRPLGLDVDATARLHHEIVALAAAGPKPVVQQKGLERLAPAVLLPLALIIPALDSVTLARGLRLSARIARAYRKMALRPLQCGRAMLPPRALRVARHLLARARRATAPLREDGTS